MIFSQTVYTMKRDAYGDDGPVHKRQRQSDDEVTFLIPSKVAGSIIGKGGSNISKLRNEYKASITVPDCPGPERVLSISASDIDTILEIVKDILPCLADGGPRGGDDEHLDVRLLIHQSRAGCVIGKAGAKIKELREKTGAKLKIFSSTAPQSTERVVQLVGNKESVAAGVREVLELVRQVPIKGAVQNYDPRTTTTTSTRTSTVASAGSAAGRAKRVAGAPRRPAAAPCDRRRRAPRPPSWPARLSGKPNPVFERSAGRAAQTLRSRSRCPAPTTASSPSPARRSRSRWRSTCCSRVSTRAIQVSAVETTECCSI